LILIDEWVAYLRNLYKVDGLPAGSFDANLTFAQALTEAAKAAPETLVVASLPASQIEIGGEGGEEALIRLKQTFSRVESTWRPASAEEGFEIVRRRLFQEDTEKHPARDLVVRRFSEMYREQSGAFPSGCGEKDYEMRMRASYPIHPELFERLYTDWGSLEKFQRTRGVLRLMAAVIHALWEGEDKNLIITSSTIPMEDKAVQSELTRYMDDSWDTVINKDVDGPNSLPLRIDRETPNLGRYSATRRVARTVYMGSAPTSGGRNPGIEEKAVMLGCVQPGETVATFGDALRRLSDNATYLYVDARRYWYSTQVGVTRLAQDRADQYDTDDVRQEIVRRLRKEIGGKGRGGFAGVHVAPESSADVPDEREARLVVFGPDHAHALRNDASDARREAERTLSGRGTNPRIYRNTLAFLAPDRQRIGDLEVRVRQYLAWDSICSDAEVLNLAPIAERQARGKREESDRAVVSQIAEVWSLCLAPEQPDPRGKVEWLDLKTTGTDGLVARASRKLQDEEMLVPALGAARLGMELSKVWADSDHIQIKRLWEYLCSYVYLLRLTSSDVLLGAIREAVSGLLESEEFAYAERHDEVTGRYRGLRLTGGGSVVMDSESVLVRMEVARRQLADDEERRRQESGTTPPPPTGSGAPSGEETSPPTPSGGGSSPPETPPAPPVESPPRRFYGSVDLDTNRVGRDAGKIAEEILTHLAALPGARVRVTLDIEADIPEGVTDRVQRVVSENASTLKFKSSGFERE
jgi:hypothetical protein